jgi:hypothetical protein
MGRQLTRVFVIRFLGSFATLFAAWVIVDFVANLDEFLDLPGSVVNRIDFILRFYGNALQSHGGFLVASLVLASTAFGGLATWRTFGMRSRVTN